MVLQILDWDTCQIPPECDWWTNLIWTSPALFGGPLTLGTWGKLPPLSAALPILSEEASMLDQVKNNTTLLLIMEALHICHTNCELINRDEGVAIPEYWQPVLDHAPRILLDLAKDAKITPTRKIPLYTECLKTKTLQIVWSCVCSKIVPTIPSQISYVPPNMLSTRGQGEKVWKHPGAEMID